MRVRKKSSNLLDPEQLEESIGAIKFIWFRRPNGSNRRKPAETTLEAGRRHFNMEVYGRFRQKYLENGVRY